MSATIFLLPKLLSSSFSAFCTLFSSGGVIVLYPNTYGQSEEILKPAMITSTKIGGMIYRVA